MIQIKCFIGRATINAVNVGTPDEMEQYRDQLLGIALNDLNDQLEKYALHNSSTMRTLSFEQKLYMDEHKGAYEMQVTAITEVLCTHRNQAGT